MTDAGTTSVPHPCGPFSVIASGAPVSATTCARSDGAASRNASRSWIRQRLRKARSVAQALWSNAWRAAAIRSEEHTSELQSLMRISYAVFCLNKKNQYSKNTQHQLDVYTQHITLSS